ncbi:hypothetical protein KY330_04185 [Candidatus Woesearchaeota archaeon]|nr:hypothetical protein [Candidatus Woesearchaeota archaeon]
MRCLEGEEEKKALEYILLAAEEAQKATCERSKCGSIIVYNNEIIGRGFNSPPGNLESQRRSSNSKDTYHKKITDKTCCIHAEQRAISNALATNPDKLSGSRLYFVRLDSEGNPSRSDEPYCTICSKEALDAGVKEFTLWQKKGVCVYDTEEYNDLSYNYKRIKKLFDS